MTDTVDNVQAMPAGLRRSSWFRWVLAVCILAGLGYYLWHRSQADRMDWSGIVAAVETIPFRMPPDVKTVPFVPIERGDCAGYNLLLITLDTTRADRMGYYGNTDIKTPVIDELALEGLFFSRAYAPAPTTLPSHATILTGLWPYHHGARLNGSSFLSDEHTTLAQILRDEGYATAAMVSAFVLDKRYGLNRGFDVYDDTVDWEVKGSSHREAERHGKDTTDVALEWLETHDGERPFFLWVHYYDPHAPYDPPEPFKTEYASMPYAGEIAFVDTQVRRLLDQLDAMEAREKTLIVLIGDHGESLGQHGEISHGIMVYDPVLHVPFLINCPGKIEPRLHVDRQVSCVDVFPTVLTMLGLDTPEPYDGVDMTREWDENRPIYSECCEGFNQHALSPLFAVRDAMYKYIYGPAPELYNLHDDPGELNDKAAALPERAEQMKEILQRLYGDDLAKAMNVAYAEQFGDEERAKLAALGYISAGVSGVPAPAALPDPKAVMPLLNQMAQLVVMFDVVDRAAAIAHLQKLADRHPDMYFLHKKLADFYFREKQYYMCLVVLERALDIHPDTAVNVLMLARCHANLRDFDEAVDAYRRAITLLPRKATGLGELGRLLLMQRRFGEAAVELEAAFMLEPNEPSIVQPFIAAMHGAGRLRELRRLLEARLETDPDFVHVRCALADVLAKEDMVPEAFEMIENALASDPEQWDLINTRSALTVEHLKGNRVRMRRAVEDMERACEATEAKNSRFLLTLALAYDRQERREDALRAANRALEVAEQAREERLVEQLRNLIERLSSGEVQ